MKTKRNDPYFAVYPVELIEEGTLAIELVDAGTGERVWRGSARMRLRVVARGMGLNRLDTVSTSEERSWPVEEMVTAILARCPLPRAARGAAAPESGEAAPPDA